VSNPSKQKGTDAENRVVAYAKERGWLHADRLTQAGVNDRGDVRLGDGIDIVIEVKGGQGALSSPHSHLRELKAEVANAKARYGAVIAKKPGSTNVGDGWVAMLPVSMFFDIIDQCYASKSPSNTHLVN
jgi:hypothetical protein